MLLLTTPIVYCASVLLWGDPKPAEAANPIPSQPCNMFKIFSLGNGSQSHFLSTFSLSIPGFNFCFFSPALPQHQGDMKHSSLLAAAASNGATWSFNLLLRLLESHQ